MNMRVQFLVDYRGKLTEEKFYKRGTIGDFRTDTALKIIAEGRAAEVPEDLPALPTETQPGAELTPAPEVAPKPKRGKRG